MISRVFLLFFTTVCFLPVIIETLFLCFFNNDHRGYNNHKGLRVRVMVFNANFNNISIISWQSVLLVEETGVPGENHRPAERH